MVEFINPINNQINYLELKLRDNDYFKWRSYNQQGQYDCIEAILKHYLYELDCTKEYKSGRPMMTNFPIYYQRLDEYYYWLIKITNPIQYNIWLNKVVQRHIDNLVFEYKYSYIKPESKKKTIKRSIKGKIKFGWMRQETKDLFTGETVYIYQNLDTGEHINSNNPNMLEELNKPKRKERTKKPKKEIDFSNFYFEFDKKD